MGPAGRTRRRWYGQRRSIGYVLGGLALASIAGLAWWSLGALHGLEPPGDDLEERFLSVQLSAHAAITIAIIWFPYQVLRLAERLVLPYWWVAKEPSPARTMLGIRDPLSTAAKMLNEAVKAASSLAKAVSGRE